MEGGCNQVISLLPSNPNHSVVLQFLVNVEQADWI